MASRARLLPILAAWAALSAACGGKVFIDMEPGAGVGGGATTSSSSSTSASSSSGAGADGGAGGGLIDAGSDGPFPPPPVAVYASSGDTLYLLDPNSKAVSVIGKFKGGCSNMLDLAVDRVGTLYGVTTTALVTIDPQTAVCTFKGGGSYPNSLSFVPQGTLDPDKEALVGYLGSQYVRIDEKNGEVATIGELGEGLGSSGDLVSIIGVGTFLTAKGGDCDDCIVQVDPVTGGLVKKIGKLPWSDVYGLAYWGGVAYGFSVGGALFQIDLATAGTQQIDIPGAPPGLSFWGAGSSTAAPE
jgi:hypothetical protein